MTAFPTCPVPSESSPSSLEAFREVASPRDPLAFWELEQQVRQQAHRQADQILGYHLSRLHQDAAFVQAAIEKVRKESPIPLIHKGYKTVSVRLPGGTRFLVKTPYLRPNHRGKRGPKRTRRGPKGVGHYPVLEAVGIRDGVSPATRSQLALYTVQAGSYQEAVHLLAERGFQVDPATLARIAQATAQADISLREIALEQARSLPLPEKGLLAGKRVRISIDGGRLRTRKAKKGRKTRRGRHRFTTPWREPRMLVIDILKEDGSTDPLRLPLYDVLLGNAQATFALVLGYLRLLGAAQAQVIVFIADGAPWIWERTHWLRLQAGIPADKWVEVIDFYHASQHLHATLDLCRNLSSSQREALFEQLRHTLRTDPKGVDRLLQQLRPYAVTRRAQKMNKALAYFEQHAARMAYAQLDAQHLPVGSGRAESAIRRVINLRFKASGTFWKEETVEGLMHLRAGLKAGRWEEMMQRVLLQTFMPPDFEPLTRAQQIALPLEEEAEATHNQPLAKAA